MKTLTTFLDEYLITRRSLGFHLNDVERNMKNFIYFLQKEKCEVISSPLALRWASHCGMTTRNNTAKRLSQVRQFATYVAVEDLRHEVPIQDLAPYPKKDKKKVFIYQKQEILRLMEATTVVFKVPMMEHIYRTLIGLLATTGLRIGELIALDQDDYKVDGAYLLIRKSKNGQSRRVLLHQSTIEKLNIYQECRNQITNRSPAFFVTTKGTRLNRVNVHLYFEKILKAAELYHETPKPRIHDLRHTFIIKTIERWYDEGVNVEPKLSYLSTYVGHISPASTYWYLNSTPELMSRVANRLNKKMEELS